MQNKKRIRENNNEEINGSKCMRSDNVNNPRNNNSKNNSKNNPGKNNIVPSPVQPVKNNSKNHNNLDELFNDFFTVIINPTKEQQPVVNYVDECRNPLCNHKTIEEDPTKPAIANISEIKDIEDLILLGRTYHCKKNKEYYGLDLRTLCNLVMPLTELRDMIGLKNIKTPIVNQILFFMRGYNKNNKCNNCVECSYGLPCSKNLPDMFHTVITGPPGVGKTQFGKILCKIFKEIGILKKGHFRIVARSDFLGKFLGHTAIKTQELIESCLDGTMFIDEAYGLGHKEGRDSFSKEALDTLNQNLSEKRNWLCIIAGYKDALETCFFSMNEGLARRFPFRYDIEGYDGEELMEIFLLKIRYESWELEFAVNDKDDEIVKKKKDKKKQDLLKFFKEHQKDFPNYGGDIETLLLNCKIVHCRKIPLYDPKKTNPTNTDPINPDQNKPDPIKPVEPKPNNPDHVNPDQNKPDPIKPVEPKPNPDQSSKLDSIEPVICSDPNKLDSNNNPDSNKSNNPDSNKIPNQKPKKLLRRIPNKNINQNQNPKQNEKIKEPITSIKDDKHNNRILSFEDIMEGFAMFSSFRKQKKDTNEPPPMMYQ